MKRAMWHPALTDHDEHDDAERLDAVTSPAAPVDEGELARLAIDASASRSALDAVVAGLRSYPAGTSSAKRAIGPLLDLWDAASAVDRSVARPVEQLLVSLVDRSVVTADEISACLDEVERVLAGLPATGWVTTGAT